jgi:hypothetical protein
MAADAEDLEALLVTYVFDMDAPVNSIVIDLREGPTALDARTEAALVRILAGAMETARRVAFISCAGSSQATRLQRLCAMHAPEVARVAASERESYEWAKAATSQTALLRPAPRASSPGGGAGRT